LIQFELLIYATPGSLCGT